MNEPRKNQVSLHWYNIQLCIDRFNYLLFADGFTFTMLIRSHFVERVRKKYQEMHFWRKFLRNGSFVIIPGEPPPPLYLFRFSYLSDVLLLYNSWMLLNYSEFATCAKFQNFVFIYYILPLKSSVVRTMLSIFVSEIAQVLGIMKFE